MESIRRYEFYKTKYGEELLIDVVTLEGIRPYIDAHPVHTLSYFDITFITGGSGTFMLNDRSYAFSAGDVLFSRPNEIRAWDKTRLPEGYALIFEEEFLLSFFNDRSFIQHLSYFHPRRPSARLNVSAVYPRLESLIRQIRAEINEQESKDRHLLRALLYEMLMLLNREYSKYEQVVADQVVQKKAPNRYIDDFIRLVESDFRVYHDTRYYADRLCITPNYLNEIVRKTMGMNPKEYIQQKIIQEAKILLAYTTHSVAQIANRLNFEDPSYFIRLFRQQTGRTPLQYRQCVIR